MGLRAWWARQHIKSAARLLERGVLNQFQYGYLVIKYGYQAMGKPLKTGTEVEYFHFTVGLSEALAEGIPPERQDAHWAPFGPFPEATMSVMMRSSPDMPARIMWSGATENAYRAAALQLRLYHRVAQRMQEWWLEQRQTWPVWSTLFVSLASALVGWVIGHFTGK